MTAIAALVVACLGTALAAAALIVTLTRPAPATAPPPAAAPAPPTYSADQIATAKTTTCSAAKRAIDGLRINTNRRAPVADDDALGWANVANARLSRLAAAALLPQRIDPATPDDIKNAAKKLSAAAGETLEFSLSETNQDDYQKSGDALNAAASQLEGLCE